MTISVPRGTKDILPAEDLTLPSPSIIRNHSKVKSASPLEIPSELALIVIGSVTVK